MKPYIVKRFKGTDEEIHAQWLESRTHGIGGSDMAAIMGLSPFRTPLDVWLEKTGRAESEDISDKPAVHWGNVLEDVVAQEFAERHPEKKVRRVNGQMWSRERPYMFADVDRLYTDEDGVTGILEIKTAGAWKSGDWGEDGSGNEGVPDYYLPQVLHYMLVTGYRRAYVAVLIGGNDYREFRIDWDDSDGEAVAQAAESFWKCFVEKEVLPQLVGTDGERAALVELFPMEEDDYLEITDRDVTPVIDGYENARYLEKSWSKEADRFKSQLMSFVGDHKGFRCKNWQVTWTRPGRITVKEIERS